MGSTILLVEDNPADAEMAMRALRKNHIGNEIIHVEDGKEALDFLFNDENEAPRLILLDLKMPRVDGIEVLRRMKSDPVRKRIPIVMLTSSKEDRDVVESYDLGANAYIVKPVDFTQFSDAVTTIGFFWMIINHPPK